jgi:hypothetical protein
VHPWKWCSSSSVCGRVVILPTSPKTLTFLLVNARINVIDACLTFCGPWLEVVAEVNCSDLTASVVCRFARLLSPLRTSLGTTWVMWRLWVSTTNLCFTDNSARFYSSFVIQTRQSLLTAPPPVEYASAQVNATMVVTRALLTCQQFTHACVCQSMLPC